MKNTTDLSIPEEQSPGSQAVRGDALDLSECEREPIHLIGSIQPHGCLLVVAGPDARVTHASANTGAFLGVRPEVLLGQPLAVALGPDAATDLLAHLAPFLVPSDEAPPARTLACERLRCRDSAVCAVTVHRYSGRVLLEFEPVSTVASVSAGSNEVTVPIVGGNTRGVSLDEPEALHQLADATVQAVAAVTGYDRVMLYMFHPDWSGEVIAEVRQPDMVPYVGLRYPATDIPEQARGLFTVNLLRVIADVAGHPVPILSEATTSGDPGEPLDLSLSGLRSVSPYHIEYLRNMEVAASLTASVMVDDRLWGMIACHHRTPYRVMPGQRATVAGLARNLADRIGVRQRQARAHRREAAADYLASLHERLEKGEGLASVLLTGATRLTDALEAEGAMIASDRAMAMIGRCPDVAEARRVLSAAVAAETGVFATEQLATLTDAADEGVAGVAVAVLSRDPLVALAVFRPPEVREVFWAGDPSKPATRDAERDRISPRRSFSAWKETNSDRSRPWASWTTELLGCIAEVVRAHLGTEDPAASGVVALQALGERFNAGADLPGGLLDGSREGLVLTVRDPACGVSVCGVNRAFRDLFGGLDDTDGTWQAVANHIGLPVDLPDRASPGPVTCEGWSRSRGRRTLEITGWSVLTLADDAGTRTWDVLSFDDVTASSRSAAALASARDKAELASRLKSEFLSNVGHDLKTPLNAIIGFSDMILAGLSGPVDDNVRRHVQTIHGAGQHLLAMINELLDLSRFETGRQSLEDEDLDLAALCRDCRGWILMQPGAEDLTWRWDIPDARVPFRGDETILRRTILNLLTNALKFTLPGGTVGLSVVSRQDGGTTVEVTDTGIGIPAEEINVVFLPFRRGNREDVKAREGFGLGLAMVKAMTEAHGGWVEVTSTLGVGSTFRLVLPPERCGAVDGITGE